MNHITQKEDVLFAEWKKANPAALFRDGVLCPDRYLASKVRVIFVLREANFRDSQTGETLQKPYDLRDEFKEQDPPNWGLPHTFWKQKLAPWCFGIAESADFQRARVVSKSRAECVEYLTRFGYVQLKKTPGNSTIKQTEFANSVLEKNGRIFLRRQFEIYQPDIIVACGISFPRTFDLLAENVFPEAVNCTGQAAFKRRCALVQTCKVNGSPTFIIETNHPSHRGKRKEVFDQLMSDYRQAVELLRQPQGATPATN